MAHKKSILSKLKKSITLKKVIKGAAKVGGALPVVGGALQSAANLFTQAKRDSTAAASAAGAQVDAVDRGDATTTTTTNNVAEPKKWLLWGGIAAAAAVLLFFVVPKLSVAKS